MEKKHFDNNPEDNKLWGVEVVEIYKGQRPWKPEGG